MKKKIILLSSVLFLCSALASCGGNSSKIILRIGFWPQSGEVKDVAMYQKWAADFEKDFPQYSIKPAPYEYSPETVGSKAQGGQLPDVFQTWVTEPETLKNSGFIRPITKALEERGWDKVMDQGMKEALTFENEIYAIPRDGYGLGLLINKRILGENDLLPQNEDGTYSLYKEDGMPAYPTTFEEIYEMSKAISENDSASGFLMYTTNKNGGWVFSNIAWNFGSTLEKKADGKVVADFNEDSTVKALTWLQNMAKDGCLFPGNGIVYNDWYSKIGSKVAMAVVGSDVLQEAKLQGKVDMGDLAFVPMPTGDGTHHYSLYGGTPFVFSKNTSDEKVDGILEFFNYIGRSPEVSDINFEAKKTGYETAKAKGQPILPTIMPWSGEEYLAKAKALEDSYINVNMEDYSPFFDTIQANKKTEEPYCAQDMYKALDEVIQALIDKPFTASPKALLETATASFQKTLDASLGQ